MVLPELASDSDFYADSSSPPDTDSPSDSEEAIRIELTTLPGPMPIFGPIFGFTQSRLCALLAASVATTAATLDRRPTREEIDAITYHTAKASAIASWGPPLGFAAGCWRAYNSRSTYRFPFYAPAKETFTPDQLGPLRGQGARTAWHLARISGYGTLGLLVGGAVFASYGVSVGVVGQMRDERLKAVKESIVGRARTGEPKKDVIYGQGSRDVGELWRDHRKSLEVGGGDDMSPTADDGVDVGFATEGEMSSRGSIEDSEKPRKGSAWTRAAANANKKTAPPRPDDFYSAQDDASPSAENMSDASDASRPPAGESAWERLRREANSNTSDTSRSRARRSRMTQRPAREEQPAGGDSFSFSSVDQDRSLAKEEAQRVFDERLEKERRGGDFGSGNEEKRW